MLTASGLAKSHGDRTLFADVTMTVGPGRRIALVGANGTGKTTLLEILVGVGEADEGEVHVAAGATIGYLPQDLPGEQGGSVLEEVLAGRAELADLAHRLPRLTDALESATGEEHDRLIHELGEAQSRFEQLGGYAREADAHQILAGLGFATRDADRPVDELSGGWRMRVSLARLLVAEPDLLVLDEPTNHLDVDSVAWLEQYLANWSGALLFVSHDRDFIDAVANRVVELAGGRATEYVGGFAEFVAEREERFARAEAAAANQAKRVAQVERFVERFRYKATKARQVQSRVKALERLEQIEVPTREELRLRFAYPPPRRASRVVAELSDVSAGYDGEPVLRDVDIVLERGRKVALVGPNGAGKTTLLRLLTGDLEPLEGSVSLGGNVDIAHFVQHQAEVLDPVKTVLEEFRTVFSETTKVGGKVRNPRTVLGSFGFPGDAADRRVAELSGGEATRLALAKALAEPVNLLVLDEPTNHLDLSSCDLLEDALVAYPSTVLLVTHDRHLIRNVADALVTVRDGTARWHEGVDEALLAPPGATTRRDRPARPAAKKAAKKAAGKSDAGPPDTKRVEAEQRNRRHRATRDVQRALQRAEREWETAESEVAELQRALADPALYEDNDKVTELIARYDQAKDRADRAMATWETKAAELAAIEAKLAAADG